ncbi:MAG TPA: S9 family peptidase, partial [Thermoanaerobaculia bacterium]
MAALLAAPLAAQTADSLEERLRKIFDNPDYKAKSFGPVRWQDDGKSYAVREESASSKDLYDVALYDTSSGRRQILVDGARLIPAGASAPVKIEDFVLSGRNRILIFSDSRKVWRQNTRGDYWVFDRSGAPLRKLGGGAPPSSLMFAKISPDGKRAAYVRDGDLYVEELSTGAVVPLTRDGSATVVNGTSDWVNEEELDIRDGFRWSPDGKHIAFWQFDTTGVDVFTLVNDTDSLMPAVKRFPYPTAGQRNSATRIGVVGAGGGGVVWLQLPGDPRETYVPRMDWVDDRTLALQQLNRLQNRNDFLLADVQSGQARRVYRDESKTWVDYVDKVWWIERNREFLWESEKDGWRHVYRVSRDGAKERRITSFEGDVIKLVGPDEKGDWLYFTASPGRATQQYLYRAKLDGSVGVERVTPAQLEGTHGYALSPDGRWAVHTASALDSPPQVELVTLPDHKSVRVLEANAILREKAASLAAGPAEFFQVGIGDGVALDAWLIKPPSFDPSKKYPLLVYVYGEPAGQTVLDQWPGERGLFHRAVASEGYLVASFDNRGTPAPRGAAWRKIVYGAVGELSSKDQAAAVRALAAERPYVDLDRVAIWGWSGGGSSTLNAMLRYPDLYKVGISVAPVPDQTLYDTIYQERYMGLPQDNPEDYAQSSPLTFADRLEGNLLVVHGTGDDNVHYQGTERLINALVAANKP